MSHSLEHAPQLSVELKSVSQGVLHVPKGAAHPLHVPAVHWTFAAQSALEQQAAHVPSGQSMVPTPHPAPHVPASVQ